jgi:hypothetical protein
MTVPQANAMNDNQFAAPTLRRTILEGSSNAIYGGLDGPRVSVMIMDIG